MPRPLIFSSFLIDSLHFPNLNGIKCLHCFCLYTRYRGNHSLMIRLVKSLLLWSILSYRFTNSLEFGYVYNTQPHWFSFHFFLQQTLMKMSFIERKIKSFVKAMHQHHCPVILASILTPLIKTKLAVRIIPLTGRTFISKKSFFNRPESRTSPIIIDFVHLRWNHIQLMEALLMTQLLMLNKMSFCFIIFMNEDIVVFNINWIMTGE